MKMKMKMKIKIKLPKKKFINISQTFHCLIDSIHFVPLPANRMFLSDESDIAVMALPGSPFITTAGPSEPPPYKSDGEGKI